MKSNKPVNESLNLDTRTAEGFVNGMLEVQNRREGYIFGGQIKRAYVENNVLNVELAWAATDRLFEPKGLVKDDRLNFSAGLDSYVVSPYGKEDICLSSSEEDETVILYSRAGKRSSNINPSKVEGLVLKTKR